MRRELNPQGRTSAPVHDDDLEIALQGAFSLHSNRDELKKGGPGIRVTKPF
jgi:hypothetical protein